MKFPAQRLATPSLPKLSVSQPTTGDEEERVDIKGQPAASREEARVATALDKLGHQYIYQFRILDIPAGVKGAYVIDFLVTTTVPLSTPVEVYGEYWHRGQLGSDDQYRLAQIEDYFRGQANEVVILWGNELGTQEDADSAVEEKVGRA